MISKVRKNRKNNPTCLFHFIKDKGVFDEIIESKCLISLTGGRAYATSIFNPYLGAGFTDKEKLKYVIIIYNFDGVFKPIINGVWDYFQVWKWWKFYRSEWVSVNKQDIGLAIQADNIKVENTSYRRFNSDLFVAFNYYIERRPYEINNTSNVIERQKLWFAIGEGFLSLLAAAFIFYGNVMTINTFLLFFDFHGSWIREIKVFFDWVLPNQDFSHILQQNKLVFFIASAIIIVIGVIIRYIYLKLRRDAICDRKRLQKLEDSSSM